MRRDAELLKDIARQVRNGRVPGIGNLSRVGSGSGDDETLCDVCGSAISSGQVVYELIFDKHGQERSMTAHLRCHELWLKTLRETN
jgi:hypothetical protein